MRTVSNRTVRPLQVMRRTVPFLLPQRNARDRPKLLLDEFELKAGYIPPANLLNKVAKSLELEQVSPSLPAEIVEEIVQNQYEAALYVINRHPIWAAIEDGETTALVAYLIEARHYLHAAAWRMAPGARAYTQPKSACAHLLAHLLEEHDHAIYFERALEEWGCHPDVLEAMRSNPVTREWIQLMRSLSGVDGLTAALISGLLETTALDRKQVHAWHDMLAQRDYMPHAAVESIRSHVAIDEDLGHGENWRLFVRECKWVLTPALTAALNAVAAVAEMLNRWFSALLDGATGLIKEELAALELSHSNSRDAMFRGLPVWHSSALRMVVRRDRESSMADAAVALAYHLPDAPVRARSPVLVQARRLRRAMTAPTVNPRSTKQLEAMLRSWMIAIDGHDLWMELQKRPSVALLWGWMHETYHYLASARRHLPAAIGACESVPIRNWLLKHLSEEAEHAELLASALTSVRWAPPLARSRPIPTTLAFTGLLEETASANWLAHSIGVAFLQLSYRPDDRRHGHFYERVLSRCPDAKALIEAMKMHDAEDTSLNHLDDTADLLRLIMAHGGDRATALDRAALIPQFAWSFLDGIYTHYRHGRASVVQRIGWN